MGVRETILRLLMWLMVTPLVLGCKPEHEPDWPYGPPLGEPPAPTVEPHSPVPLSDLFDELEIFETGEATTPDSLTAALAVEERDSVQESDADEPREIAHWLDDETLISLRRPLTAAERDGAQREAVRAARLRRSMQLRDALARYRAALELMPGHVAANYGAAQTLALLGSSSEAARHLAILAVVDSEASREALGRARTDSSLRTLRADPLFRAATGFGRIVVGAPSADLRGDAAHDLVARLERAHLPAEVKLLADADLVPGPTEEPRIYHADGSQNLALANEVARVLGDTAIIKELPCDTLAELNAEVVVAWPPALEGREDLPEPLVEGRMEDLLDLRLQARDDFGLHLLRLRSTGFFEKETRATGGDEIRRRRGRYVFDEEAGELLMDYEETIESYPDESDLPDITTARGEESLPVELLPDGGLRLGNQTYHRAGRR